MPDESDANGNSSSASMELPVTDVAKQLGVNLPRLLRLLKKPTFAAHVHKRDRPTRTGTRTVTSVSVSVIPELKAILSSEDNVTGQKHSHAEVLMMVPDERLTSYVEMITAPYRQHSATLTATLSALLRREEEDREERKRLQARVLQLEAENEQLKSITAMAQPVEPVTPSTPAPFTDALSDSLTRPDPQTMPSSPNEAQGGQKPGILGTIAAAWEAFTGRR